MCAILLFNPSEAAREELIYAAEPRFAAYGQDIINPEEPRLLGESDDLDEVRDCTARELGDERGLPLVWILDRTTWQKLPARRHLSRRISTRMGARRAA